MRRVKLKDVCLDITVGHVGPMADQYVDEGIPFLRSQNVLPFRIDFTNLKFINEGFHRKLKKSALAPGDVVVVRTGYPGTASVIPPRLNVANCADLVVIRPSAEINGHFLACIFNSAWGRGTVAGSLVGVAQQHFNIGVAREMEVSLPPIHAQTRIASVLSAYDNLIENNTRRIKILEEMAQMLYREWFVHFRFPGHEKVRIVESELGPIPEGWTVQPLSDVYRTGSGGTPSRKEPAYFGGTIRWVKTQELLDCFIHETDECITEEGLNKSSAKLYPEGTVLMAMYGATIGKLGILANEATCNQASCAILPKSSGFGPEFAYLTLLLRRVDILALRMGAAQQNISQEVIKAFPILVPGSSLATSFTQKVQPIFRLIGLLQAKNRNLRTTRDLLLPKLISGEISIEGVENGAAVREEENALHA